ncbi:MAG: hypothetical protein WBP93_10700 [Pyrinomonadaceae bacterium]
MNSFVQQNQEQQHSRAVANIFSGEASATRSSEPHQFSALQQRANLRPQALHVAQMQQMFNQSSRSRAPVQMKENKTGMPDNLKAGLEHLSGLSLDDTQVEYNSSEPARFQANAITQGKKISVAPGQEKHLGHEGWHRIQQLQGRVQATTQMHGTPVNDDSALEREADVMGAKASSLSVSSPVERFSSANSKSNLSAINTRPVGQRQPWKKFAGGLGLSYLTSMMNNYRKQQAIKANPEQYLQPGKEEKGRLRAVYETSKGKSGQAAYAMHLPVSLGHLFFGNWGGSNIGEHYAKDIPHMLQGPDTDEHLKAIGKAETENFWDKQTGFPYLAGKVLSAEGRGNTLIRFRDYRNKLKKYSENWSNYIYGPHYYNLLHQVRPKESHLSEEESSQKTYSIIKKHPAPLSLGRESTEEGTTMWIPPFGQIHTTADPSKKQVTNLTVPGKHILDPGWVTRTAEGENIRTEGGGHGVFPKANEWFSDYLWGSMAYRDRLKNDPQFRQQHYEDVIEQVNSSSIMRE